MPQGFIPTGPNPADEFLDTIPEDQSVAQQRVANLSTASAVASSDSGERRKRGRRHRTGPSSDTGASDTQAVLEAGQDSEHAKLGASSSQLPFIRRAAFFYGILFVLVVGVAVGVFFVISVTDDGDDDNDQSSNSSFIPSASATLSPISLEFPSDMPTSPPTANIEFINDLDSVALEITSADDYSNVSSPQGQCRDWMTRNDVWGPTYGGEDRLVLILERYVLCVLHRSTGGVSTWPTDHANGDFVRHCFWSGVNCIDGLVVSIDSSSVATTWSGTLPSEVVHLSSLVYFFASNENLTGPIPEPLMNLPNLRQVVLRNNSLTGSLPLGTAPSLVGLYLDDNMLEGAIPYYPTLKLLHGRRNRFSGFDHLYSISEKLEYFVVEDNLIQGPLPTSWTASAMKSLVLSGNPLRSPIPTQLWNLASLQSLVLQNCSMTGELPSAASGSNLEYVWLGSNQLSGEIPPSLGSAWSGLLSLHLNSNQLSGPVPSSLGSNWVNLDNLRLHDNDLTGSIDEQCDNWPSLTELTADCNLHCPCCTEDCFEE